MILHIYFFVQILHISVYFCSQSVQISYIRGTCALIRKVETLSKGRPGKMFNVGIQVMMIKLSTFENETLQHVNIPINLTLVLLGLQN
jgi:hypothetical protein